MRRVSRATLLLLGLGIGTSGVGDDAVFVNTDVFELELATDPQISPDGSRIAYLRNSMDIMSDRRVANIWMVDADGRNHRPLLSGAQNYSQPRWSPNGDRLAFVTNLEGRGSQIHVRWMDTGEVAVLTNVREQPTSITWSPDGTQLAFEMFVDREIEPLAAPPSSCCIAAPVLRPAGVSPCWYSTGQP